MRFLLFFLLMLFSFTGFVRGQSIEWGNPQKIKQKNLYSQIVGETPSGLFVLRCRNTDFSSDVIIEKYKSNLSLDISVPAPMPVNGNIERIILVNGELYMFISARNTQTNQIDLLVQRIDNSLKALGGPKVICSVPDNKFIEKRKIQIKTSADKKHLLVMFLSKSGTDGTCFLNLYGYNGNAEQVFGKQFSISRNHEDVFITNFDSDNQGNAFVLLDYPREKAEKGMDPREFYLFSYFPSEDKMLAFPVGNEQLFIEELALCVNNFHHSVTVAGFYSEAENTAVNGYFMDRINIDTKTAEEKYASRIDADALQLVTGSKIERKNPDLKSYYIRKLIPRSDGGIFLVAEKFTRIEQHFSYYQNNIPMDGIRVTYNYDDVILFSLNKNGSVHFGDIIRKRQSSVGDAGYLSGVFILPTQDNIYVLYNSELDKDGNIMARNVSYTGKSDERIAVKSTNFSVAIIPGECKQTGISTFVGATIRDKQFMLMRLTY